MNIGSRLLCSLRLSYIQRANYGKLPPELVFPMNDSMIVCWHPEKQFPYEHSLPLPPEVEDNSVLTVSRQDVEDVFMPETPQKIADDLAKVTYTTKHRWFPRKRDKKAKKTLPDRPYL